MEPEELPPERTVYVLIPKDMVGRVIGREGRNIRILRALTDTDIDFSKNGRVVSFRGHATDAEMGARFLWYIFKNDFVLHPDGIRMQLRDWYREKSNDDRLYFEARDEEFRANEAAQKVKDREHLEALKRGN